MQVKEAERLIKGIDKNRSLYDPSRNTVGSIYRDAQLQGNSSPVLVGDMANELTKSLVEDINDALSAPRKDSSPFYLIIHEKKDLQMKSAILRRMITYSFRPWPEDDTTVFWFNPKTQELRFCWSIPHWSEMDNAIANPDQFDKEFIAQIKAWKEYDLKPFGFYYHPEHRWIPNPKWKDTPIENYKRNATVPD